MRRVDGSFRDPSGYVFDAGDSIVRSVNPVFREHWLFGIESGFFAAAVASRKLIPFDETGALPGAWKTLRTAKIPFVSYPYEWCFSQLKDAALLTLRLQLDALAKGMILKDASAFNVLYDGSSPVFIDLLSFEKWQDGEPWKAYRQFSMHFLAPLALISKVDLRCGFMSRLWMDGIPLDVAAKMLPWRSRFNLGLYMHLFLHAKMQERHGDARKSAARVNAIKISAKSLAGIAENLVSTVQKLKPPSAATEWGDYYNDTNYTDEAAAFKLDMVERVAGTASGELAVDMGANTGKYSAVLSRFFRTVLAPDIDPLAVERHYRHLKDMGPHNILPLVLDLGNPTPGIGWAGTERASFGARCRADLINALALVHHLVVTAGIPLDRIAAYFAELLRPDGTLLLEFVPKEDSQVVRMLAARGDVFYDYHVEGMRAALSLHFNEVDCFPVPESMRTLHIFKKKEALQ